MPLEAPPTRLAANGSALADEVYDLLAEAIVTGALAPGEHLRDVEIAAAYGISRTPVREAIQRLERQDLVEIAAHRYTRVTIPDDSSQPQATEFIGRLSADAVGLALQRGTEEQLTELLTLLDSVIEASAAGDDEMMMTRMVAFHRSSTIATRNRFLIRVLREVHLPIRRAVGGWRPYGEDRAACTQSFRELRRAVEARDSDAAERIVREQHPLA